MSPIVLMSSFMQFNHFLISALVYIIGNLNLMHIFNNTQFSHSVMSDSLRLFGLPMQKHIRLPHPSLIPKAYSNSCPLSQRCHPTISTFLVTFFSSVFPSIRVFSSESVLCTRQPSIGVSASVSVLPMNIQDWFPSGLSSLISLQSKGLSRVFFNTTVQKHQFFGVQICLWSNSHIYRPLSTK